MANRKIGFYFLSLRQRDFEFPIKDNLIQLLNYLQERTRLERKQDIGEDKIVFLDSCTQEGDDNLLKLLFKNAKHSYRAPLINKNTVEERENPKEIDEGEQMKTHALVKFKDGDGILFLETGGGMLSYHGLAEYLNRMLALYNGQFTNDERKILGHFCIDMIPRDDFREVLNTPSAPPARPLKCLSPQAPVGP